MYCVIHIQNRVYTPFPNLFSVHYKFPENDAILRQLIIFDKVTWRETLMPTFLNVCLMNDIEKKNWYLRRKKWQIQMAKIINVYAIICNKRNHLHRKSSCKISGLAIAKTLDRGKKFKKERYISADSITTSTKGEKFYINWKCKASMKKEFRSMEVSLDRNTGFVTAAKCSCPAGNSAYCNHIMVLLLQLADYLLNQLDSVQEEISCTSKNRQWGIPSEAQNI